MWYWTWITPTSITLVCYDVLHEISLFYGYFMVEFNYTCSVIFYFRISTKYIKWTHLNLCVRGVQITTRVARVARKLTQMSPNFLSENSLVIIVKSNFPRVTLPHRTQHRPMPSYLTLPPSYSAWARWQWCHSPPQSCFGSPSFMNCMVSAWCDVA